MQQDFCVFLYLCFRKNITVKLAIQKSIRTGSKSAKKFVNAYLNKCENDDFTKFDEFTLSKRLEKFFSEKIEGSCKKSIELYGKLTVLNLNSAYLNEYSKDYDPLDLYIFDAQSEKSQDIKYISVWVYHDQNVISGIWISKEKPLGKSKPKDDDKKESAL